MISDDVLRDPLSEGGDGLRRVDARAFGAIAPSTT
jgi:hypothetical protein